jgi:hypothetical protein
MHLILVKNLVNPVQSEYSMVIFDRIANNRLDGLQLSLTRDQQEKRTNKQILNPRKAIPGPTKIVRELECRFLHCHYKRDQAQSLPAKTTSKTQLTVLIRL